MLKPVEYLQSAGAFQAAVKGYYPADLSVLGGGGTSLPFTLGRDLAANAANVLEVLEDLPDGDATSIIGVVVAAIKGIVSAIRKAAAQREINYAEARTSLIANVRGVVPVDSLRSFGGGRAGDWTFPRASVAEDKHIPYWDPIGILDSNLPAEFWPYKNLPAFQPIPGALPGAFDMPAGNWLTDGCENWNQISLGADCSGPYTRVLGMKVFIRDILNGKNKVAGIPPITTIAWPWAWPLTCPSRAIGNWTKYSKGPEEATAGLYMLPTIQHVLTREADVNESERILMLALKRFYPEAYLAQRGDWRTTGPDSNTTIPFARLQFNKRDGEYMGNVGGPSFAALAVSLARIDGFRRCREAMRQNPEALPVELQQRLDENPDFSKPAEFPTFPANEVDPVIPPLQGAPVPQGSAGGDNGMAAPLLLGAAALAAWKLWR